MGVRAYGTAPATPPNTANQKSQTKNGRIFGKMRGPGLCRFTCPNPVQQKRKGPSTSALRPQQARDTRASRLPVARYHWESVANAGGFGRRRYRRWPRRKLAIASLDGVQQTAVPPRFTAAVADAPVAVVSPRKGRAINLVPWCPRWSVPQMRHRRRVCGGRAPATGVGDSYGGDPKIWLSMSGLLRGRWLWCYSRHWCRVGPRRA